MTASTGTGPAAPQPVPVAGAAVSAASVWQRDDHAPDRVRRPGHPLLARFNDAEVLTAADVHVARQLGRSAGEGEPTVLLALALTVRALRQGSVCLDLRTVRGSVLGSAGAAGPAGDVAEQVAAAVAAGDVELARQLELQSALDWPDADGWLAAVRASPLVTVDDGQPAADGAAAAAAAGGGPGRPLRLADGLLYLDKYWRHEQTVLAQLTARAAAPPDATDAAVTAWRQQAVPRLFPDDEHECRQRTAAAVAVGHGLTVVAGGPGTGKTTAVARILAVLAADAERPLRVALAAPTGKAAARLGQAVRQELARVDDADSRGLAVSEAATLHRLLGARPGTSRLRFHAGRHLPHDVVVVDETSMVSLSMMAALLQAVRPDARVLLVGDPDQLASVEAGAVLGDVVGRAARTGPTDPVASALPGVAVDPVDADDGRAIAAGVVRLIHRFRFGEEIGRLADAIRAGDAEQTLAVLADGGRKVEWIDALAVDTDPAMAAVRQDVVDTARRLTVAAVAGDTAAALAAMDEHRMLCAHRTGPFGAGWWARVVQRWIAADRQVRPVPGLQLPAAPARGPAGQDAWWEPGRPLIITENDYELGLFNGDTGVVVQDPERGLVAVFGDPADPTRVRPGRLAGVQSVHAMTVHKSQGSQFGTVSVVLPPPQSPLLTRELLYTAATRASGRVRIIGAADAVTAAVQRPVSRASGLR